MENVNEGDHIVVSIMEHHSNLVPWQQVALKKKAVLDIVELTDDYRLNLDQLKEFLEKSPKIVALNHMSNSLGTINPIKDISRWVHDSGSLLLVDGAQSAPHIPIDMQQLDVDFYTVSSHKMCGPSGLGFLYGKYDLLEQMDPIMYGGDMIREVHARTAKWNNVPFKFETGTPNIADTIAYGTAIDYLSDIGMDNIHAYEQDLTKYFIKRISEDQDVEIIGPNTHEDRGSVFSFTVTDLHPHDVAQLLDQEGVAIRSGHHCTMPLMEYLNLPATSRASIYLYNEKREIDYFMNALKIVKDFFA
jgi:cysteine desulfurase/selenocysteine lyase